MTFILGGLVLTLAAIWFGSYYVCKYNGYWQCFPAFLTAILVAIVGLVMIINEMTSKSQLNHNQNSEVSIVQE